jgi:hypothetical protein
MENERNMMHMWIQGMAIWGRFSRHEQQLTSCERDHDLRFQENKQAGDQKEMAQTDYI